MLDLKMRYIASYVYDLIHFNELDSENLDSRLLQITSFSNTKL
jgi:hypothetical protein